MKSLSVSYTLKRYKGKIKKIIANKKKIVIISRSDLKGRICRKEKNYFLKVVPKFHPRHFTYINEMEITKYLSGCSYVPHFVKYEDNSTESIFYYNYYKNYYTLEDIIKYNSYISSHRISSIKEQLEQILENLHKKRITHRDINPRNILVSLRTLSVVLIDFQWAKINNTELPTKTVIEEQTLKDCLSRLNSAYRSKDIIDDYENDLYALKKIIQELMLKVKRVKH